MNGVKDYGPVVVTSRIIKAFEGLVLKQLLSLVIDHKAMQSLAVALTYMFHRAYWIQSGHWRDPVPFYRRSVPC